MGERRQNFGSAVVDGRPVYFSPSSLTTADPEQYGGCLRRWFFKYVEHRKEPFTAAQKTGVEMHSQIEHYLRTGEKTLGPLAMAIARWIPKPSSTNEVEFSLVETERKMLGTIDPETGEEAYIDLIVSSPLTAAGVPVVGYGDLLIRNAETWIDTEGDVQPNRPNTVEPIDWKSTSNIENAKSGAQLVNTIQMPGYGEWAARTNGTPVDWIRLSHVTSVTKGKSKGVKRSILVPREDIARRWEYAEGIARSAIDVAAETDANKVPANTDACGAYRGCPHAAVCSAKKSKTLAGLFGQTQAKEMTMSVLGMLNLPKPSAAAPVPAPTAEPIATPTSTGVTLSMSEQVAALKKAEADALAARAAAPVATVPPVAQLPVPAGFDTAVGAIRAANMGQPALSAQVAAPWAKVIGIDISAGAGLAGHGMLGQLTLIDPAQVIQLAQELAGVPASQPDPTATAPVTPEPAPVQTPAPAANPLVSPQTPASKPELAANPIETATPAPTSETTSSAPALPKKRSPGRPRKAETAPPTGPNVDQTDGGELEIYVNSMPTGGADDLAPYVAALCKVACKAGNTEDVRVAPSKDSPLAYGGWKGVLAALARESLPPAGRYYLLITGEITEAIADGLAEFVVARGVRA